MAAATSAQPFTLLQLSDCHLPADPEASYRGENADRNLSALLPACRRLQPDGVVMTGDLAEDAAPEAYRRLVALVEDLSPRIAWLPGNHDVREVMTEVFEDAGFSAGPRLDWGGWQLLLLDSASPDRPEGHLEGRRLEPLRLLEPGRPTGVFVHHQPMPVDSAWIDKYPLTDADRLFAALPADTVRFIGFGHVHQSFVGERDGIRCLACPSSAINGLPGGERFSPDPTGPKARWYRLWDDGRWLSGLVSAG